MCVYITRSDSTSALAVFRSRSASSRAASRVAAASSSASVRVRLAYSKHGRVGESQFFPLRVSNACAAPSTVSGRESVLPSAYFQSGIITRGTPQPRCACASPSTGADGVVCVCMYVCIYIYVCMHACMYV